MSSVEAIGATGLSGNLKFKNGYCSSFDFCFGADVFEQLSKVLIFAFGKMRKSTSKISRPSLVYHRI